MKYKKRDLTEEEQKEVKRLKEKAEIEWSKYNETDEPKYARKYCEIMDRIKMIQYKYVD